MMTAAPRTMLQKIWHAHRVADRPDGRELLLIDRHFVHDGSVPSFDMLADAGLPVRRPDRTLSLVDHFAPTWKGRPAGIRDDLAIILRRFAHHAATHRIDHFDLAHRLQGIVHVVGPELGISLPGMTIVCGDSHTSTHGAVGALAFGIGASQGMQALATQTVWLSPPRSIRIRVTGTLGTGVTAKDLVLTIVGQIGASGASGSVIEYAGPAIEALSMEGRLTVCNMSIEAGARAGLIAPDDVTIDYLRGRLYTPVGDAFDRAADDWRALRSDTDAAFDREVEIDASVVAPTITWGTSPQDVIPITGVVPDPASESDPERRATMRQALNYMDLTPGAPLAGTPIDRVFLGSCTNGRLEDLRAAADILRDRKIAPGIRAIAVPGSMSVKRAAEQEGLDKVLLNAGFEWHEAGCSMCVGMNGETAAPGERVASTSNRNFIGRQGPGVRTHLVSPPMAAAAAVAGRLVDVRELGRE